MRNCTLYYTVPQNVSKPLFGVFSMRLVDAMPFLGKYFLIRSFSFLTFWSFFIYNEVVKTSCVKFSLLAGAVPAVLFTRDKLHSPSLKFAKSEFYLGIRKSSIKFIRNQLNLKNAPPTYRVKITHSS